MVNWTNEKPVTANAGDTYTHDGVVYVARKDAGQTVWDVVPTTGGGNPGSKVKYLSKFYCGDGCTDTYSDGVVLIDQADNVRVGLGPSHYKCRGWHTSYHNFNTLSLPLGHTPKQVYQTRHQTYVVTTQGKVFAAGFNNYRQLAYQDNSQETSNPTLKPVLPTTSPVKKVCHLARGETTAFYLLEDGTLMGSGHNPHGYMFGNGDAKDTRKNGSIEPMYNVSQNINSGNSSIKDFMACGHHGGGIGYSYNHTAVALTTDGEIYTSGYNGYGSRGDGTTGNGGTDLYRKYRQVRQGGASQFNFVKIKAAAGGPNAHAVYALTDSGHLLAWGYNGHGQLGNGNTTSTGTPYDMTDGVIDFWVGGGHSATVFVKKSDGIYSCGYNGYGQLGLGNTTTQKTLKKNNLPANVDKIFTGSDFKQNSVYARTTDGKLYSCGDNTHGHLGLGHFTRATTFQQIDLPCYPSQVRNMATIYGGGNGYLMVVDPSGSLYACGNAAYHLFNEGGGRHAALLTRVNVL